MLTGPLGGFVVRRIRRLVTSLVVLGALFAGGNVLLQQAAEKRVAGVAQTAFDLPEPPLVSLSAFPIVVRMIQGRIPAATLRATRVPLEGGLTLDSVRIRLDGITVSGGVTSLVGSGDAEVLIDRGSAVAEVTNEDLNAYLVRKKVPARVTLTDGAARLSASRVIAGRRHVITAAGRVALAGAALRFTPRSVRLDGRAPPSFLAGEARQAATLTVLLPPLPGEVRVETLEVREGLVRLTGSVRNYRFRTKGGERVAPVGRPG